MTGVEILAEHAERFNEGVRSGNFERMLELFTENAVLEFDGVPVGPFHGIDAIREAYRERPPDDEIEVDDPRQLNDVIVAPYSWRADAGRRAGELQLTVRDGRIARLVVTFAS